MLYILITALNVILNKLKMKDSNIISFIYSRHDRILYVNLVGVFKNCTCLNNQKCTLLNYHFQ
ncbi:hypothetical protein IRJ11_02480 [Staphylococcus aureus]|nr:hypothetical protein [Staphylococcus aureus]MBE9382731.1 hypothetical protein [Staphylococcus aureus]